MASNSKRREPQCVESSAYIASDDDSEIDEDEAFNSEDELMYGGFFSLDDNKKKKKKSEGNKKVGEDESEDDNSDDDDDDEDDGSSDDSNENDWAGSSSDDDDSGEEDDGGQYMLDLLNNLDKQVVAPPSAKNNNKKNGKEREGGKISLDTLASEAAVHLKESEYQSGALAAMSTTNNGNNNGNDNNKLTLDSLMGGIADTAGFTSVQKSMRALHSSTTPKGGRDTNNDGTTTTTKKLETTSVPVPRIVSERASRKVHTIATTQDISHWKDAVHEQRDAETLDFRTNPGGATLNRVTRDTLVDKFEPRSEFEMELQCALEEAGMEDEKLMEQKERVRLTGEDDNNGEAGGNAITATMMDSTTDDLGSHQITLSEYKKRHGELAKLRALMFYEEQKRHRINKIKSKKYRKIRKRRADRLKDAEDESERLNNNSGEEERMERERMEQEEMDRMKERMTLAHKNTSKWAKRALRRGSKMDVEERKALSLQIAKGDELRRKVMGVDETNTNESDDEDETEESLLGKARDILMENDNDDENGDGKGKKKGLFQLEFMKRGMEAQRSRAKEEARKLLEELEANEMACAASDDDDYDSEDSNDENENKEEKKQLSSNKKKKKEASITEAETKKVLPEGKLVASSLQFGKADGFAIKVDGNIELDVNIARSEQKKAAEEDDTDEVNGGGGNGGKKKSRKKKKKRGVDDNLAAATTAAAAVATSAGTTMQEEEEENPWITSKSTSKSSKKKLSRTVNINEAASMLVDTDDKNSSNSVKRKRNGNGEESNEENKKPSSSNETKETTDTNKPVVDADKKKDNVVGVAELSQAELVRRAFAAPADLEAAEEEFQKEKERMKERDDPTRKKKEEKIVSGWGSWAGAGAPPPRKKPRKLPPKLRAPTSKKAENAQPKRKDDGLSTVIINEKRLKKTSKFQLSEIPYPYKSREEYERAIAGNIGQEWNTINGTKEMSRPAVLVRAGKIIQHIGMKSKSSSKQKRAPAKF
ncbi:hypothetical protein ACHAXR_006534 [Thalassiosira sp. AJA248-18]